MLWRLRREEICLHGSAECHHLVGIDVRQRLEAEQLADECPNRRYSRRSADQDDAVQPFAVGDARILQGAPARWSGSPDQRLDDAFHLDTRQEPLAAAQLHLDAIRAGQ